MLFRRNGALLIFPAGLDAGENIPAVAVFAVGRRSVHDPDRRKVQLVPVIIIGFQVGVHPVQDLGITARRTAHGGDVGERAVTVGRGVDTRSAAGLRTRGDHLPPRFQIEVVTAGREIVGYADLAEIVPRLGRAAANRIEGEAAHQRSNGPRTQTADENIVLDIAVVDTERHIGRQVFEDFIIQARVDKEIVDFVLALDAGQHSHRIGNVHHRVDPGIFGQDSSAVIDLVDSGQRRV